MPKPRMTRSDTWKKRPVVVKYWQYKDKLVECAAKLGYELEDEIEVVFNIQMPDSWSKKKKESMDGWPHQATPDVDNCLKGLMDCLVSQDKAVWRVVAEKRWAYEGSIHIKTYKD